MKQLTRTHSISSKVTRRTTTFQGIPRHLRGPEDLSNKELLRGAQIERLVSRLLRDFLFQEPLVAQADVLGTRTCTGSRRGVLCSLAVAQAHRVCMLSLCFRFTSSSTCLFNSPFGGAIPCGPSSLHHVPGTRRCTCSGMDCPATPVARSTLTVSGLTSSSTCLISILQTKCCLSTRECPEIAPCCP
ncbi:hypothetical protein DIPPA_52453 [Diplonema papillatum]|nr:hypothetical protein DIPPA_52453 [Diplonema papillatum]